MTQEQPDRSRWLIASAHALPISLLILALFYYWFGVADRYAVFLYEHMGATPFDEVTASRYWMAGLVADGWVMVLYTAFNTAAGRLWRERYIAPAWRVWVVCAPFLAVGIPAITMTVNRPTLPVLNALECTAATLAGLIVAHMPGKLAAERPADLVWLAADGLALVPVLITLRVVELPRRGVGITPLVAGLVAAGSIIGGVIWLGLMTLARRRGHRLSPGAGAIFLAGLGESYILMPLAHHLFATPPGYPYITTASNFFAYDPFLQAAVLIIAGGLAWGAARVRERGIKN